MVCLLAGLAVAGIEVTCVEPFLKVIMSPFWKEGEMNSSTIVKNPIFIMVHTQVTVIGMLYQNMTLPMCSIHVAICDTCIAIFTYHCLCFHASFSKQIKI